MLIISDLNVEFHFYYHALMNSLHESIYNYIQSTGRREGYPESIRTVTCSPPCSLP